MLPDFLVILPLPHLLLKFKDIILHLNFEYFLLVIKLHLKLEVLILYLALICRKCRCCVRFDSCDYFLNLLTHPVDQCFVIVLDRL